MDIPLLVKAPCHDLDGVAFDECTNHAQQLFTLDVGQPALADDHSDALFELMAWFVPLVLGHQAVQLWPSEELAASTAEQLGTSTLASTTTITPRVLDADRRARKARQGIST